MISAAQDVRRYSSRELFTRAADQLETIAHTYAEQVRPSITIRRLR